MIMGRLERKIQKFLLRLVGKVLVWILTAPLELLRWIFKPHSNRKINSRGYVVLTDTGELEHRYLARQKLGRKLRKYEVVHHINGARADNDISNLCLMNNEKHEHFHAWLKWKKEKSGRYPSLKRQKIVLEKEYGGVLLTKIRKEPKKVTSNSPKQKGKLLIELKSTRKRLATKQGIPVYMIFKNSTLEEMAEKMPLTKADLRQIKGVGPKKVSQYGDHFISEIKSFKKVSGD